MNQSTRTIKKYPNRRLYDTRESRYITLQDIGELVMRGETLKVLENKTGREITAATLLQALIEIDSLGDAPMSDKFLARVMQAQGRGLNHQIRRYLDLSLELAQAATSVPPYQGNGSGNGQEDANYRRWLEARDDIASAWTAPEELSSSTNTRS